MSGRIIQTRAVKTCYGKRVISAARDKSKRIPRGIAGCDLKILGQPYRMGQLFDLIIGENIQFLEILYLPLCTFVCKNYVVGGTFTLPI